MTLEDEVRHLRGLNWRFPVRPKFEIPVSTRPPINEITPVKTIDLNSVLDSLNYIIQSKQNEIRELRKDFLEITRNTGSYHFSREWKREILEKYFPDEIKKRPYSAGGDL